MDQPSPQSQLHRLIEHAAAAAEALFAKQGRIAPMWHAIRSDGSDLVLPLPSPDKETAAILVRAAFKIHDVVRYVMVAEGWHLAAKASEQELAEIRLHGLAGHRAAVEAVLFQAEDISGGKLTAYRAIIRPRRKTRLGPLEFDAIRRGEERLVGTLPAKTPD
jgi:hypothetical protein